MKTTPLLRLANGYAHGILVSDVKGMKQRIKSTLFHLPKVIIFGLALLNFLYIQSHIPIRTGTKISFCMICPWYETSDFKDVLIILAASVFLLISKRWSYFIAGMSSGFVLFVGLFYINKSSRKLWLIWTFAVYSKAGENLFRMGSSSCFGRTCFLFYNFLFVARCLSHKILVVCIAKAQQNVNFLTKQNTS